MLVGRWNLEPEDRSKEKEPVGQVVPTWTYVASKYHLPQSEVTTKYT